MKLYNDNNEPFTPNDVTLGEDLNPIYTKDDQETVIKVLTVFDYDRRRLADCFSRQMLCLEFLHDRQFSEKELELFSKDGRAPIVQNILSTIVSGVEGLMRLGKPDISVHPVGPGMDIQMADTAKKILDSISYENHLDDLCSIIFYGGLTFLDSWHVYTEDDPNFGGYIKKVCVERPELGSVIYDPDFTDPRMTDMRRVTRLKYMSKDDLQEYYPKTQRLTFSNIEHDEWWKELQSGDAFKNFKDTFQQPLVDRQNGLYAVLDFHEKRRQKKVVIMDSNLGSVGELPVGKFNAAYVQQRLPVGLFAIDVDLKMIYRTTIMPYQFQVLEEENEECESWPYIPYASKHKGCRLSQASSYVFSLIGTQRARNIDATNKREFMTRTIRGGWMTDNEGDETALKKSGGKINPVIRIKDLRNPPQRIAPPDVSASIAALSRESDENLQLIAGISLQQTYGGSEPGEPGIVRKQRREESQTTLYPYLEDFYNKEALAAEAILERACKVIQPGQMLRMTGDDNKPTYMQASEQLVSKFKESKWDIRIMDGPFATTQKREQQEERFIILNLASGIDPLVAKTLLPEVIGGSSIDNAEELKEIAMQIITPQIAAGLVNVIAPPTQSTGGLTGESNSVPPKQ